jgi:hypothetical protein
MPEYNKLEVAEKIRLSRAKNKAPFKQVVLPRYALKYFYIPEHWGEDKDNFYDTGYSKDALRKHLKVSVRTAFKDPYIQGCHYIEIGYLREIHRLDCIVKLYELTQKKLAYNNTTVQRILNERIQRVRVPKSSDARRSERVSYGRQGEALQNSTDP